jgi:D-glycero-D-manno-heptose 1,7-bisphosphate phosphatase
MRKAVFIDKDGTLIEDIPYNVDPAQIKLQEGTGSCLRQLKDKGYLLFLISNQSGVARGYFDVNALGDVIDKIQSDLSKENVQLDGSYFCPHHPQGSIKEYAIECACRKPKPGMILNAAESFNIHLADSWMIGDILHDIEAGNSAGCKTILINNGNETEWKMSFLRKPNTIVKNFREATETILKNDGPL